MSDCSGFGFFYSYIRNHLYRASLCYENQYLPLVVNVFMSGLLAGVAPLHFDSAWQIILEKHFKDLKWTLVLVNNIHLF
ncbi:hypothetical protein I4U23_008691 [Adineta vaga]|nr:hypothetical protein I4U23_008691 [Adineta vaga]